MPPLDVPPARSARPATTSPPAGFAPSPARHSYRTILSRDSLRHHRPQYATRATVLLGPALACCLIAGLAACAARQEPVTIPRVDLPDSPPPAVVSTDDPTSVALALLNDPSLPPDTVADLIERLAAEHPDSAGIHEALGRASEQQDDVDKAIQAYRKAVEIDPSRAKAWLHLGILLKRNARDPNGAIEALRKALETGAPRPRTLNELGVAYAYTGDVRRALGVWDQAIQEDPDWGVLYANSLKASLQLGDEPLARSYYERGMNCAHPEPNVALQWGEYLADNKRADEAVQVYDRAASRLPDSPRVAYYHAQALRQAGLDDRARVEFLRAIRLDSEGTNGQIAIWSRRALFILDFPKEEKAFQEYIKEYFEAMQKDQDARRPRLEALQPKVEALVEAHPEFWNAWSLLAWINRRLGYYDEAGRNLERVLAIYPDEPNAVHEQGLLLRERGRLDEAYDTLLKANRLAPRDPAVLSNLALTEIDLGQSAKARQRIRQIEEWFGREAGAPLRKYLDDRRAGKVPRPGERPEVPIGKRLE